MNALAKVIGKWPREKFVEIARRERNWQESIYGSTSDLAPTPTSKFGTLRETAMGLASKPVTFSDMISAVPTALGAYKKALEEGKSEGDAVYMGNREVRRAHGSTSQFNRTAIVRNSSPWMTSGLQLLLGYS